MHTRCTHIDVGRAGRLLFCALSARATGFFTDFKYSWLRLISFPSPFLLDNNILK